MHSLAGGWAGSCGQTHARPRVRCRAGATIAWPEAPCTVLALQGSSTAPRRVHNQRSTSACLSCWSGVQQAAVAAVAPTPRLHQGTCRAAFSCWAYSGSRGAGERQTSSLGPELSDGMAASTQWTTDLEARLQRRGRVAISAGARSSSGTSISSGGSHFSSSNGAGRSGTQAASLGSGASTRLWTPPRSGSGVQVVAGAELEALDHHLTRRHDPAMSSNMSPRVYMGSYEARGPKNKMEDRHVLKALHPELGALDMEGPVDGLHLALAAVFDGHAGDATAIQATQRLPDLLHKALLKRQLYDSYGSGHEAACDYTSKGAVASSFRRFDRWWNDARTNPRVTKYGWDESGATAVVGLVAGGTLLVGNAGDSTALLVRDGVPQRLSVEHRPDRNQEEAERVVGAGGRLVSRTPGGALRVVGGTSQTRYRGTMVTRSLGDFAWKFPQPLLLADPHTECVPLLPRADELVVLASDGVTDVLGDQAMLELAMEQVRQEVDRSGDWKAAADEGAKAIVEAALKAGSRDNCTAVIMLLDWSDITP